MIDENTLETYGLNKNSTIFVVFRLLGGKLVSISVQLCNSKQEIINLSIEDTKTI
jgi:hypothetical protein